MIRVALGAILTAAERKLVLVPVSFLLLTATYDFLFARFFWNETGALGRDYTWAMPNLLAGFYWSQQNGFLELPWFSPHVCGGIPQFAHPQSMYLSTIQLLFHWLNPVAAVYVTFVLFAFLGLTGFYVLLRAHGCRSSTALLGGALFMFNGFYAHRIVIGHVVYHSFMLAPWIMYFLTAKRRPGERWLIETGRIAAAALCFGYVVFSGGLNLVLPLGLAVALCVCLLELFGARHARRGIHWPRLIAAAAAFLALVSTKVNLALELIARMPRDSYALPGYADVMDVVLIPLQLFFIGAEVPELANLQIPLRRHEWEFGLSAVPALILLGAAGRWAIRRAPTDGDAALDAPAKTWPLWSVMLLIVVAVLSMTYYTPAWNSVLKQIPVVKTLSSPFRWYCAFIPPIVLVASLSFERFALERRAQRGAVLVAIVALIASQLLADRTYYERQAYDPSAIIRSHARVIRTGEVPPIETIHVYEVKDRETGRILVRPKFLGADDVMIEGGSHLYGNEDLFGYRNEFFPMRQLRPGSVYEVRRNVYNMKNPAGYLFPTENNVAFGGHFRVDQREALDLFLQYRPFPFEIPAWQTALNIVSLATLVLCILASLAASLTTLRARGSRSLPPRRQVDSPRANTPDPGSDDDLLPAASVKPDE